MSPLQYTGRLAGRGDFPPQFPPPRPVACCCYPPHDEQRLQSYSRTESIYNCINCILNRPMDKRIGRRGSIEDAVHLLWLFCWMPRPKQSSGARAPNNNRPSRSSRRPRRTGRRRDRRNDGPNPIWEGPRGQKNPQKKGVRTPAVAPCLFF